LGRKVRRENGFVRQLLNKIFMAGKRGGGGQGGREKWIAGLLKTLPQSHLGLININTEIII